MATPSSPTRKIGSAAAAISPSRQLAKGASNGSGGVSSGSAGGGRKVSTLEGQPLVRVQKQREELESMRHQNEMTRLDAVRGAREARIGVNTSVAQEVRRLQDQADLYLQRIQAEKRRIAGLEGQIKTAQLKVLEQKQKTGGVNASKENDAVIAKQIRLLENRLDKELVKFNQALAENKNLRERIDRLRKDRVIFDNVYKRLERCLHEKKNEMTRVIEDAKRVCIARDKAKSELATIKQQAEKDKAEFEREWKELGRLIEEDRRLRDALKRRIQDTAAAAQQQKQQQQQQKAGVQPASSLLSLSPSGKGPLASGKDAGPQQQQQQQQQQQRVASPSPASSNPSGLLKPAVTGAAEPLAGIPPEKLQYYEEAFHGVQAATGIGDVDELVTKLLEAEEQNFSLFNYVNELNAEIEQLEQLVAENQAEVERHKGHGASTDLQQKRLARAMEERLQRTRARADEHEQRHAAAVKTINQLKTGIHGIFSRLGCGTGGATAVEEMLGNQGVTESNMMQYLGVIEQRTIEILQMYAASQQAPAAGGGAGEAGAPGALSPAAVAVGVGIKPTQPPPPPLRLRVQLPTFEEVDGAGGHGGVGDGAECGNSAGAAYEEEDDDRPLTREELQRRTATGLRPLESSLSSWGGQIHGQGQLQQAPPPSQQAASSAKAVVVGGAVVVASKPKQAGSGGVVGGIPESKA